MKGFRLAVLVITIMLTTCAGPKPAQEQSEIFTPPTNFPKPTSRIITPTKVQSSKLSASTITPTELQTITAGDLISLDMFDATNGWGLTGTRVARTTDAGSTWMDYSPAAQFSGGSLGTSFFLNKESAWLLVPDPDEYFARGTLFWTNDGGSNWTSATTPFGGGSLTFLDEKNGWMMADLGAGAGSQAVAVYRTTDAGRSWKFIFTNDPTRQGADTTLPLGGLKYDLVPLDMNTAFIGGVVYSPGTVYLFRSQDSGMTWERVPLVLPSGTEDAEISFQTLHLVDQNNGFLALRLFTEDQKLILYTTHDRGENWTKLPDEFTPGGMVQFLSASEGVIYNDGSFWFTRDSGQSWSKVQPNKEFGETLSVIDFIDNDHGWVLAYDDSSNPNLFRTSDGGKSWLPAVQ